MNGWADDRLMAVYDTINDISTVLQFHTTAYQLAREMLDAIENLDDAIRDQSID